MGLRKKVVMRSAEISLIQQEVNANDFGGKNRNNTVSELIKYQFADTL